MRYLCILLLSAILSSSSVAQQWRPTPLDLDVPDVVYYNFEGDLSIDVNVSGTPSRTVFCIFTRDSADNNVDVRNGYLGWHYVNKVDTCIYYNKGQNMQIGANSIIWDGADMDGNEVPSGKYWYYIFGYDFVHSRENVASVISIGSGRYDNIITHDYQGNPYSQPILYTDPFGNGTNSEGNPGFIIGSAGRDGDIPGEPANRMKWLIGSEPDDPSEIERTWYPVWLEHAQYEPSPFAPDMFYTVTNDPINYTGHMRRYTWVSNGESELDTAWGEEGDVTWSILTEGSWWCRMSAAFSYIGDCSFIGSDTDYSGISTQSTLPVIDAIDGYILNNIDLSDWWIRPDDGIDHDGEQGQQSGGPSFAEYRMVHGQPLLLLTGHTSCLVNVINPFDPDADWQRWVNGNGDQVGDRNWEPDDKNAWVCNDYSYPARTYSASIDNDGFVMTAAFDQGPVSFNLFGPDGTGIGAFAFAEEYRGRNFISHVVQYNSGYDGIYCDNEYSGGGSTLVEEDPCDKTSIKKTTGAISDSDIRDWYESVGGVWYVAHDSARGVITGTVGDYFGPVSVEDIPAVLSLVRNTPNPFNPSTTITFSLAEAGFATAEIYNSGGQRLITILKKFLEPGNHSAVFDGGTYAAGMYFCRVSCGGYSEIVKMMLIK